jgi:hypothetical protein
MNRIRLRHVAADSLRPHALLGARLLRGTRKLRTVPSTPLLALTLVVVTFLAVAVPIASGDLDPRLGDAETIIVGPRQSQDDRIREVLGASGIAGVIAMVLAAVAVRATHATAPSSRPSS